MIRLRVAPFFPKQQLYKDPVFGIVSKNTLFGVHRTSLRSDLDNDCSKTMVVLSNNRKVVESMVQYLEQRQGWGIGIDRVLHQGNCMLPNVTANLAPLRIEQFNFGDMEKMCCIHNFDMYIAYSIQEDKINFPPNVVVDGYEHITQEWPQRGIVERYMRDMLYKD
jgi:hypothetical protein